MIGRLSLPFGIISILGLILGFIPCLGWFNWINVPFAMVGLVFCAVGMADPETRGAAIGGAVLCLAAIFFGILRLLLGGGLI